MEQILYPLVILLCPLGMGVMMWIMMRADKTKPRDRSPEDSTAEVARLRAEVDEMRAARRLDSSSEPSDVQLR